MNSLTAPLDGMWETGFINTARHWLIEWDGQLSGYYVVNDEGVLLQFFVLPSYGPFSQHIFEKAIQQSTITSAIVHTNDSAFLSLCLDFQVHVSVHTYLYELQREVVPTHPLEDDVTFHQAEPEEASRVMDFQIACLGGQEHLRPWLEVYSANLIDRGELFVLRRGDYWIGLGEYRKSDTQENVVDVGVMVHPGERGRQWATFILALMVKNGQSDVSRIICSTTVENVAAQKAILRAGFASRNRILQVALSS